MLGASLCGIFVLVGLGLVLTGAEGPRWPMALLRVGAGLIVLLLGLRVGGLL